MSLSKKSEMSSPMSETQRRPVGFAERLLLALSRDPAAPDYPTTTAQYTLENCLAFPRKTVPGFDQIMKDQTVLDYGCGPGWQAVAMHLQCGARRVAGIDINQNWLSMGRALAEKEGVSGAVTFGSEIPIELNHAFDIAISISSFEHFGNPASHLKQMADAVKPNGRVIVTFAEPWLSHSGSHMDFFTKVPWVNLWFSERTIMQARSHFRSDGATRYEDIEGGLNRMTLAKFKRIIKASGMRIEQLYYYSTRNLPLVDKIPVVREFLVSSATCVLRKTTS
jgi:ubiquinone/menaquinone biosynthesis C-methylase UbiE